MVVTKLTLIGLLVASSYGIQNTENKWTNTSGLWLKNVGQEIVGYGSGEKTLMGMAYTASREEVFERIDMPSWTQPDTTRASYSYATHVTSQHAAIPCTYSSRLQEATTTTCYAKEGGLSRAKNYQTLTYEKSEKNMSAGQNKLTSQRSMESPNHMSRRYYWVKSGPVSYDIASVFGPGLYGDGTACGQTLTRTTVGVAHKTLKCGTLVRICHARKCADVRVIDRGPFSGDRTWDITEGTTKRVWGVNAKYWGVRKVRAFRIRKVKATGHSPAKRPTYPSHLRSTL